MTFSRSGAAVSVAALLFFLSSCERNAESPPPLNGGIVAPRLMSPSGDGREIGAALSARRAAPPMVSLGANYGILASLDEDFDSDPVAEQVLVAIPLDNEDAPLELAVASTDSIGNQHTVVWNTPLSTRLITDIALKGEDLTANGRNELILTGFNNEGRHITEIYAVPENGQLADFVQIFSRVVDGNIDIISTPSLPNIGGQIEGTPSHIVVQNTDSSSDNALDFIETRWDWDPREFRYRQTSSKQVKAETILEEHIAEVYRGGVSAYENYLRGAWYRENGDDPYQDILYFNPVNREILFYSGSVQEVFIWRTSHRTTAKRLYTRVNNAVITSLSARLSVSAESWEELDLMEAPSEWKGSYRRLTSQLQSLLESDAFLPSILESRTLTGVWKSSDGNEIVFDLPRVEWLEESRTRVGTASLFSLNNSLVLQIQFLKRNGAVEETENWLAAYEEDRDETRVIRSLSLTPARLSVDGIQSGEQWIRYEQIEVFSSANE